MGKELRKAAYEFFRDGPAGPPPEVFEEDSYGGPVLGMILIAAVFAALYFTLVALAGGL